MNIPEKAKNFKKKRLTSSDIAEIFSTDKPKLKIKAVLNPIAPTNTQCGIGKGREFDLEAVISIAERAKKMAPKLYYLIILHYQSALRISEILAISPKDIQKDGSVIVKSKKGSRETIINGGLSSTFLVECRKKNTSPFWEFNRFFIHRLYKNLGITFKSQNSSKNSTTHAFRHIQAKQLRENNVEENFITEKLRHKNPKNTKIYGNKKGS